MVAVVAAQAGLQVAGGIAGDIMSAGDRKKADADRVEAQKLWEKLHPLEAEQLKYDATNADYAGDVTASDLYVPETANNELRGITTDPSLAIAQKESMRAYDDIISGGGLTDMDRLNAERAMTASAQQASTQSADIQQDMARRGMSGSGNELLAKLVGSQGSVNRLADQQKDLQAVAQQRALDAISRKGGLATKFRGQDFDEKARVAEAGNAIQEFNIGGATKSNLAHANNVLSADQGNQTTKNTVNLKNAGFDNTASSENVVNTIKGKGQEIQITDGQASSLQQSANASDARAKDTKDKWAAGGNLGATAMGGGGK